MSPHTVQGRHQHEFKECLGPVKLSPTSCGAWGDFSGSGCLDFEATKQAGAIAKALCGDTHLVNH